MTTTTTTTRTRTNDNDDDDEDEDDHEGGDGDEGCGVDDERDDDGGKDDERGRFAHACMVSDYIWGSVITLVLLHVVATRCRKLCIRCVERVHAQASFPAGRP